MNNLPPVALTSRNFLRLIFAFTCCLQTAFLSLGWSQANYATPYYFSTFAGTTGGPEYVDGTGRNARFGDPRKLAIDANGNIYVADSLYRVVRKITPAGVVTTLAGSPDGKGAVDGIGANASFDYLNGIAVDRNGTVYVSDNRVIRKITPAGAVSVLAGMYNTPGIVDGDATNARFVSPAGMATDGAGNLYVTEDAACTVRKITPTGTVTTIAGSPQAKGSSDGIGSNAHFDNPTSVAVDGNGLLYVTDTDSSTIRQITPAGVVTTLAGDPYRIGGVDGTGGAARFYYPSGIALDATGTIYVVDRGNSIIRKIAPGGVVTTLAGAATIQGSTDGVGTAARFQLPEDIAVDGQGNLYVADSKNCTIRKISSAAVVSTFAGSAPEFGSADGTGTSARFSFPQNLTVDSKGNVYVADTFNHTVRKITPAGVVTTLAGFPGEAGNVDGTQTTARLDYPQGVAVDDSGNVYVTSNFNVRKITPAGVVTTLAGTAGAGGSTDGTGTSARFGRPLGITVDSKGNVYVADQGNYTIRKISPAGEVTTFAGVAGSYGKTDGVGANARFSWPEGLAIDHSDNIYVADTGNALIRKITAAGVVSTLAGGANTGRGIDGVGAAAGFINPSGVCVDAAGNVYVADLFNLTIRKITPQGETTTVGGEVGWIGSSDGTGRDAHFYYAGGVAVDQTGNLYVANSGNNNIRKGQLATTPVITTQPQSQTVSNGGSVQFSVTAGGVPAPTYQWYFNGGVFNGATTNTLSFSSARTADAGDYTVVVTNSLGNVTSGKATLTVNTAVTPPPTTGGSGGGGGTIGSCFVAALSALAASRRIRMYRTMSGAVSRLAQRFCNRLDDYW